MRFSTALALSAVPAAVFAANQTVTVGDGGMLQFNPTSVTAGVGDFVNFEFRAKNHSVTQSTFAAPCDKAMFNGSAGVSSGFMAIPPNNTIQNGQWPTWSIQVKDTKPLWFHCGQKIPANHCQMGMVFSINPASTDKTADAFQAAAKASSDNSTDPAAAPGGAAPSGAAPAGATDSGSATASSGASPTDSAAAASATGSGVAPAGAAAGTAGAANAAGTSAADQSTPTSGASTTALKRGAAGLFTVAAAVCAVLL